MAGESVRVWFPIKAGVLRRTVGPRPKAVDDINLNLSMREAAHGRCRRRKRLGQDHPWLLRLLRLISSSPGAIRIRRSEEIQGLDS